MKIRLLRRDTTSVLIDASGIMFGSSWWVVDHLTVSSKLVVITPCADLRWRIAQQDTFPFRYPPQDPAVAPDYNPTLYSSLMPVQRGLGEFVNYLPTGLQRGLYLQFASFRSHSGTSAGMARYYGVSNSWRPFIRNCQSTQQTIYIPDAEMVRFCIQVAEYLCNYMSDPIRAVTHMGDRP